MRRSIDTIIIHCAVTPNGGLLTSEAVDSWHTKRGFKRSGRFMVAHNKSLAGIGYHYLIVDGMPISTGRHLEEIGAHAHGHNSHSIGICLAGTDKFTLDQWEKLRDLVQELLLLNPRAKVIGHYEVNEHKTCPNFDVNVWLACGMNPMADHLLEPKPAGTTPQ